MSGEKVHNIKLTDRQERFCREYTVDYNATQAAIRAGYSEKTAKQIGQQNLTKLDLLARVRELQKEQAERLCISADWVVMQWVEVYKRCMQAVEVLIWDYDEKKMKPSGEYTFDSKGALNALEMIGKHLGMFTEDKKKSDQQTLERLDKVLGGIKSGF
ncbi:MAG: terminase small subunit [Clostridia bacterium]|nr:terminase small subunit [Clostridia bacterium]